MAPFTLNHIDHVVFRVADLDRSVAFYRDVLGCTMDKWRDDLGLVHLRAGTALIDLVSLTGRLGIEGGAGPGREGRNVDHVCLRVAPFDEDAILNHLVHYGVQPLAPVAINYGADGNGPSLYIKDPDGNVVELKGPSGD